MLEKDVIMEIGSQNEEGKETQKNKDKTKIIKEIHENFIHTYYIYIYCGCLVTELVPIFLWSHAP